MSYMDKLIKMFGLLLLVTLLGNAWAGWKCKNGIPYWCPCVTDERPCSSPQFGLNCGDWCSGCLPTNSNGIAVYKLSYPCHPPFTQTPFTGGTRHITNIIPPSGSCITAAVAGDTLIATWQGYLETAGTNIPETNSVLLHDDGCGILSLYIQSTNHADILFCQEDLRANQGGNRNYTNCITYKNSWTMQPCSATGFLPRWSTLQTDVANNPTNFHYNNGSPDCSPNAADIFLSNDGDYNSCYWEGWGWTNHHYRTHIYYNNGNHDTNTIWTYQLTEYEYVCSFDDCGSNYCACPYTYCDIGDGGNLWSGTMTNRLSTGTLYRTSGWLTNTTTRIIPK